MKLKIYMRKLQMFDKNHLPIYYDGPNPNSLQVINGLIANNVWIEMTRYVDNLDEFSASWKVKSNDSKGISNIDKSVSTELQLFDEGYKFVMTWLNDHVAAPLNAIEVRVEMVNCGTIDDYVIKTDGISYCDSDLCNVEVALKQKDDLYTCIYSTLITDNHLGMFSGNYQHPRFSYCNEFRPVILLSILFAIMNIVFFLLWIIYTVVFPIWWALYQFINAINTILDGIASAIPGNQDWSVGNIPRPDTPGDVMDEMVDLYVDLFGCGKEHPAPLIRDYIRNVCSKCGITITEESIPLFFKPSSQYYNLTMLSAEVKKGADKDNNIFWIPDNDPLLTLDMLLDKLKIIFNAKWFIKNNILYFDRHDKFDNDTFLYDFNGADKKLLLEGICYAWNEEKKPAYSRAGYSVDALDVLTTDCLRRYNDIVEYNTPVINPMLEGSDNRISSDFAPTRFRGDGVYKDYVSQTMQATGIANTVIGIIGLVWHNQVKQKMKEFSEAIIMQNHTALLPKLIIWNGQSKRAARAVSSYEFNTSNMPIPNTVYNINNLSYQTANQGDETYDNYYNKNNRLINYPMYFDAMFKGNLWDFHQIDDPRFNPPTNKTFELSIPLCCEDVTKLGILNNSGGVNLERKVKVNGGTFYQDGVIKDISLNFSPDGKLGRHIKIKGKI